MLKLQDSIEDILGKRLLVRVIGRFGKSKVREMGIPLYWEFLKICPAPEFREVLPSSKICLS